MQLGLAEMTKIEEEKEDHDLVQESVNGPGHHPEAPLGRVEVAAQDQAGVAVAQDQGGIRKGPQQGDHLRHHLHQDRDRESLLAGADQKR